MITCDYCGRENPDDAPACSGCASPLREEAPVLKQTKAGFWIRAAARIIDILFLLLLSFATAAIVGLLVTLGSRWEWLPEDWPDRLTGVSLLMYLFSLLAAVGYHTVCEGLYGATLGKLCFGLRVIHEDGGPSNLKGAFIRSLAYRFVDVLFLGAAGYYSMSKSPLNQRYGDRWGKTAVIKTDELAAESKRSTTQLFLALGLGIGLFILLEVIGLMFKIWET